MTPLERKLADKLLETMIAQNFPEHQLVSSYRELIIASSMRYHLEKEIKEDHTLRALDPAEQDLGGRAPASEEEA